MITVDAIFADDRRNPPSDRSLPWEETRGDVTVVVEPKPHWASDMKTFRLLERVYCYYADWTRNGPEAQFFVHPDTRGDDVMMKARAMISGEIAAGVWAVREEEFGRFGHDGMKVGREASAARRGDPSMNALTPISPGTPLSRAISAVAEARRFPLWVRCLGEIDYAQDDPADGAFPIPRTLDLAMSASLSEAIARIERLALQDMVASGGENGFHFTPRLFFVVDNEQCLVIAGEPWQGGIKWCAPVASDGEARLVVHTASKLRGEASREANSDNHDNARILRFRASVLEGRLVHSNWRQRASTHCSRRREVIS